MSTRVDAPSDKNTNDYRDGAGLRLVDYPRPSVAVDTAVLTVVAIDSDSPELAVLQIRRSAGRGWALPGTFLHPGERLIDAVLRSLRDKAHVVGRRPRQLQVFDDPDRDDRGWVLSAAHVDVVPIGLLSSRDPLRTRLAGLDRPGRLPFGHNDIVRLARDDLRTRYTASPDPDHLLGETFTLRELRAAHEAVAGRPLQRDTFRRAMQPMLAATGATTVRVRGRPAELFERVRR